MDLVLYDCLLRLMKVSLDSPIHLIFISKFWIKGTV